MNPLSTDRLNLPPITANLVEAVLFGRREEAEALVGARFPAAWPGVALVERAFGCPLTRLKDDPESYLWGGRILVRKGPVPLVVGSVVLNGRPDATGTVEVAYGTESASQGKGYATEGTAAVVDWALDQEGVRRVTAATTAWHHASLRIIEKLGMKPAGTRPHELFGDLLIFEVTRETFRRGVRSSFVPSPPSSRCLESSADGVRIERG